MGAFTFFVDGEPKGKGRPRWTRKGGHAYTPTETVKYEKHIQKAFREAGGKMFPAECYVKVIVYAYFKIPKSFNAKMREECKRGIRKPIKKPDGDNILKVVEDALNGLAYVDDSHVVTGIYHKLYAHDDGPGFLSVSVSEDKQ